MRIIIFDIVTYIINALPPGYRQSKFVLFMQSLMFGLLWNQNAFDIFRRNVAVPYYDNTATYGLNDVVIFNFQVYISLKAANTANSPDASPLWWYKIVDNFIGVNERVMYTGRKLTLEWALNKYFNTTFRQPDDPIAPTNSDIYITPGVIAFPSFLVGTTEASSDSISTIDSSGWVATIEVYAFASPFTFSINIPATVYTALGATNPIRDAVIRSFADLYVRCGANYSIIPY